MKGESRRKTKMNKHKLRCITEYIKNSGKMPRDQWGDVLSVDELMVYFDLEDCLDKHEQAFMRIELASMVEADLFIDRFKLKRA
jgi:hypothetical protein